MVTARGPVACMLGAPRSGSAHGTRGVRRRRCFDRDSKSYPDMDPGLAPYLARTEQITEKQFYEMVNHESGLLGTSEISSDMRDLLAQETADVRAAEAVALFCYQTKNGSAA